MTQAAKRDNHKKIVYYKSNKKDKAYAKARTASKKHNILRSA